MTWYRRPLIQHLIAPAVFASMTLAMFHGVLFQNVLLAASASTDLALQFIPWRAFGFGQLSHGHLPLWNPYIYGGTPYFAGFQSALLYPPNWLHLALPLNVAINWIIAIHVFLAGYFTSLWARGRGTSVAASILAGSMFMFGGTYFLHVYAGHLPHLCLMVWLPLLFLTIEKLAHTGSLSWCWLGVIVMSMIILAGHPQYVYYTGIITVLYTALLLKGCKSKTNLIAGYAIILVAACGLTAVQLFSGLQAAGESVRSGGTSYEFASMFALPPENLLTFLVPNFFGTLPTTADPQPAVAYFGRCYLWEMSVFISISGLVLSCFAIIGNWRRHWRMGIIIIVSLTLALGKHLPLYRTLFDNLPMYGSFRDVAKFTVFLTLFLSVLAADGYEQLLERQSTSRWIIFPVIVFSSAVAMFVVACCIASGSSTWVDLIRSIRDSMETYVPLARFSDPQFIAASSAAATHATYFAAGVLLLIALIIAAVRFWKPAALGLVALAMVESFVAASQSYSTSPGEIRLPDAWLQPIHQLLGNDRVLNGSIPGGGEVQFLNAGMTFGFRDAWGYDPGVLKRYAELLASSQHIDPHQASQYLSVTQAQPSFLQLLRCRLVLFLDKGQPRAIQIPNPLPRGLLLPRWTLSTTTDETLAAINAANFDPRQSVLLESAPPILPSQSGASGPADVAEADTDTLEIKAHTDGPTLLLLTENYSTGWEATPLGDSDTTQTHYDIFPADHALMAIALDKGTHHIRLHYCPAAFTAGAMVSTGSLIAYVASGWWCLRSLLPRRRLKVRPDPAEID